MAKAQPPQRRWATAAQHHGGTWHLGSCGCHAAKKVIFWSSLPGWASIIAAIACFPIATYSNFNESPPLCVCHYREHPSLEFPNIKFDLEILKQFVHTHTDIYIYIHVCVCKYTDRERLRHSSSRSAYKVRPRSS